MKKVYYDLDSYYIAKLNDRNSCVRLKMTPKTNNNSFENDNEGE